MSVSIQCQLKSKIVNTHPTTDSSTGSLVTYYIFSSERSEVAGFGKFWGFVKLKKREISFSPFESYVSPLSIAFSLLSPFLYSSFDDSSLRRSEDRLLIDILP